MIILSETNLWALFMTALWSEVCLATAALSALDDEFEVSIVTDASGGVTLAAHEMAVQRIMLATRNRG
jgi:nicotinamidase-related amidase